jgi:cytidylate kinase
MAEVPVITVDGPSGTGKGTVCRFLAATLGWHLLDSGALYRVVAHAALTRGLDLEDPAALAGLAADLQVDFVQENPAGERKVLLQGEDVGRPIRTEECGNIASKIAAYPEVRKALVEKQRSFKRPPGLVADGRDMGTVIFPEAGLKLFLTAGPEERARRRYKQLIEQGISVNLARLSAEIEERDARDQGRAASPLTPASEAIVIDTTNFTVDEVNGKVLALVRERYSGLFTEKQ